MRSNCVSDLVLFIMRSKCLILVCFPLFKLLKNPKPSNSSVKFESEDIYLFDSIKLCNKKILFKISIDFKIFKLKWLYNLLLLSALYIYLFYFTLDMIMIDIMIMIQFTFAYLDLPTHTLTFIVIILGLNPSYITLLNKSTVSLTNIKIKSFRHTIN